MSQYEDQEKLFARTRGWIELAAAKGGEFLIGCSGCGRSFDWRDTPDRDIAKDGLPCGCDALPFPLHRLRHPGTYGLDYPDPEKP